MRFIHFQIIGTLALYGLQYWFYRKMRRDFGGLPFFGRFSLVIATIFVIFSAPLTITILFRSIGKGLPHWFLFYVMYPVYIWHFISILIVALLLAGKLVKAPFLALGWLAGKLEVSKPIVASLRSNEAVRKFDAGRRRVVRQSFAIIAGGAAVGSAFELYRSGTYEQSTIRLQVRNLPESFQGFSIAFISDIHSGIFMSAERMHEYATAVNSLDADMIIVTGDFVNLYLDEVYPFKEAFRSLSAPSGVFGVLGNHDYYTRQVEEVAREVERTGISLLRNRYLPIERGGDTIHLAGIDDTGNPETAVRGFAQIAGKPSEAGSKILLCHRPYFFKEAAAAGFDLVLSGHTHGGQVVLGAIGKDVLSPARLVSPYVSGLYTEGTSKMYVSRGLGTVSIPIRFNCPPEITKIILERQATVASQAL
jgi:predicted MPP superfamily phosphohydrolase